MRPVADRAFLVDVLNCFSSSTLSGFEASLLYDDYGLRRVRGDQLAIVDPHCRPEQNGAVSSTASTSADGSG